MCTCMQHMLVPQLQSTLFVHKSSVSHTVKAQSCSLVQFLISTYSIMKIYLNRVGYTMNSFILLAARVASTFNLLSHILIGGFEEPVLEIDFGTRTRPLTRLYSELSCLILFIQCSKLSMIVIMLLR